MADKKTTAEQERQRKQARIGLASNVLGITAGTAALGSALTNPALKKPTKENAGPVTGRAVRRIKMSPNTARHLIRGGAVGAAALQAANLGGDFVANRVLSREANKPVKKNDASVISKADGAVRQSGHGSSLVVKEFTRRKPREGVAYVPGVGYMRGHRESVENPKPVRVAGAVLEGTGLGITGAMVGSVVGGSKARDKVHEHYKNHNMSNSRHLRVLRVQRRVADRGYRQGGIRGAALGAVAGAGLGYAETKYRRQFLPGPAPVAKGVNLKAVGGKVADRYAPMRETWRKVHPDEVSDAGMRARAKAEHWQIIEQGPDKRVLNSKLVRRDAAIAGGTGAVVGGGAYAAKRKDKKPVQKSYRRFDPEADRQRRLGLATGAAAGGAIVTGNAARRQFGAVRNGGKLVGIKVKGGRGKAGALVAGTTGLAGLAAGSYKRGLDVRNQPWT